MRSGAAPMPMEEESGQVDGRWARAAGFGQAKPLLWWLAQLEFLLIRAVGLGSYPPIAAARRWSGDDNTIYL
ncbi:hypothetical protein RB195_015791 [Necator americanus]|uniref:Uncharacterized protein n=1 Tax=Necator americanus TaxID=51031 RepID=A0ABR1E667_NECAM